MSNLRKPFIYSFAIALGLLAATGVLAWTGPSSSPPGGNASAPLNVSNVGQVKVGGLQLNSGGAATGLIVGGATQLNGAITGTYGLLPSYEGWAAYGTGAGGAAIYNDNGSYKTLMIVGNNSAGGVRTVGIWDNLNVSGAITSAGQAVCLANGTNCPAAGASTQWTTSGSSIYYNGGNVGIGTLNPLATLTIQNNGSTPALSLYDATGLLRGKIGNLFNMQLFTSTGAANSQIAGDGTSNSYLNALGGNVGIGNSGPSYKLDVSGDTRANSFIVNGGGTYAPGAIYSDSNYGLLMESRVAGAVSAFEVNNSLNTNLLSITNSGAVTIPGSATVGGSAVCTANGTNCPASANLSNYLQLNTWQGSHYFGSDGTEYAIIYRDTNNSGYYVWPSQTSNLNSVVANELYTNDNLHLGYNGGFWLSNYLNQSVTSGASPTFNTINGLSGGVGLGAVSNGWYSDSANLAVRVPSTSGGTYFQDSSGGRTWAEIGAPWGGINVNGNATVTGSLTVSGQSVCLANGTNCPASTGVGGSGTAGSIPRFTTGTALGNSSLTSDGISTTANGNFFVTGNSYLTGNVAIGTASPYGTLDVHETTNQNINFVTNTNGAYSGAAGIMAINDANSAYEPMGIYASQIALLGGNVGIGNSGPSYKLDVSGDTRANSFIVNGGGTYAPGAIYSDSNWGMLLRAAVPGAIGAFTVRNSVGTELLSITNSGAVTIPGSATVGGSAVCTANGTNCPASANLSNYLQLNTWQGSHYFGSDGTEEATVYYDKNNTGYYVVPSQTSILNAVSANELYSNDNLHLGYNGGFWLSNYLNQPVTTISSPTFANLTVNGGENVYSASTLTTAGTARQITVGESTNNSAYKLALGYYLDSGATWTGVVQATASNAGSNLLLNPIGGNVGVGVTAPQAKLNVLAANSLTTNDLMFTYDASGDYRNGIANHFDGSPAPSDNQMSFLVSNGTISGQVTAMTLLGNGNVGVGTVAPAAKVEIDGSTSQPALSVSDSGPDNGPTYGMVNLTRPADTTKADLAFIRSGTYVWQMGYVQNTNTFGIFPFNFSGTQGTPTMAFSGSNVTVSGQITASAFYYNSDERLKKNIAAIASSTALADILALEPVTYNWINPALATTTQLGFIAQQVKQVVPEIVTTDASTTMEAVDYARVTPLLVGAAQAQQAQLETQQQEIDELTAEINALKAAH